MNQLKKILFAAVLLMAVFAPPAGLFAGESAEEYLEKGNTHLFDREYDRAISDFSSAIEINPDYAEAYYRRGCTYNKTKDYDKALSDLTRAVEIDPTHARAFNKRGSVYMLHTDDRARGCADLKRGCELGACRGYRLAKFFRACKEPEKVKSAETRNKEGGTP
ncbi:MAG: tetratricopeptide repeat protein [Thermodesulfobacteriota bacterium]